jgi:hypothetical protein
MDATVLGTEEWVANVGRNLWADAFRGIGMCCKRTRNKGTNAFVRGLGISRGHALLNSLYTGYTV